MTDNNTIIQDLKGQHGKVVAVEIDSVLLVFRPMNKAALGKLQKDIRKNPDMELDLSVGAVGLHCVHGAEHYAELSSKYPSAFVGGDGFQGVLNHMLDISKGNAQITVV